MQQHSRKKNICDLSLKELEQTMVAWGEANGSTSLTISPERSRRAKFRARQIFAWVYQKGALNFAQMSDLPSGLREKLKADFYLSSLTLIKALKSKDGTEKLLFGLKDGNYLEAVTIPAKGRNTACISTQVGCKFACGFCASGALGFKRNLTGGEILNEVLFLKNRLPGKKLTHIVFMGTGEPLDNYDQVLKAIRVINAPWGMNIGARRITVSSAGIIPAISRLADEGLQIELSVSLHAADSATRGKLMPINKIYPLASLISCCRDYFKKTNRQVTFEYILIKGINSDLQSARILGKILQGMDSKVNLIPANPIKELRIAAPDKQEIARFQETLLKNGIKATLRRPRGTDIAAACGQLKLQYA